MKFDSGQIRAAACLLERERGSSVDPGDVGVREGIGFMGQSPDAVQHALVRAIEESLISPEDLPGAYFALGKRRDRALKGWFQQALRREANHDSDTVYQIMIALDDLGEPVFDRTQRTGFSAREKEDNLRDALKYLSRMNAGQVDGGERG